jgi:hypothetical protein
MNGHVSYLDGGLECKSGIEIARRRTPCSPEAVDTREILPLNEAQVRQDCKAVRAKGLTDIAVIGVFSPLDMSGKQEARVKQIVLEEIPEADVVLSRDGKLAPYQPSVYAKIPQSVNSDILRERTLQF